MKIRDIYNEVEPERIILIPPKWLYYEKVGNEEYLSCVSGPKTSGKIKIENTFGICECKEHTIIGYYDNKGKPGIAWFPNPKMKRQCCTEGRYKNVISFLEEKLNTKLRFDEKEFRNELWRL